MGNLPQLRAFIQGSIRAEKARRNMTFAELSVALRAYGIEQSATNLSTKVGRGDMSAQLYVAIMKALGRNRIELDEIDLQRNPARQPAKAKRKRR